MKLSSLAAVVIASLIAVPAFAQSSEDKGPGPSSHRGPPPEAIEVCESSASGDSCMFEGRDGSVEGICRPGPRYEEQLACVPAKRPSHSDRKPRPRDEKGE